MRWLAEAAWFPYAFAGEAIRWELVSAEAARATLVQEGVPVGAIVEFDPRRTLSRCSRR
jgi:hypothetical protein